MGKALIRRFEVVAAILLGVLLPGLETARRGMAYWSVNFTTMFEDYVAGIVLLVAAAGAYKRAAWAPAWLIISWSGISFMMLVSTVSQVEKQMRGDLEPHSLLVLAIKVLLLLASVYALLRSVRAHPATSN
jgi:hypothetical protein